MHPASIERLSQSPRTQRETSDVHCPFYPGDTVYRSIDRSQNRGKGTSEELGLDQVPCLCRISRGFRGFVVRDVSIHLDMESLEICIIID